MPTTWLSTKQASEKLGITFRTLYKLIDTKGLPAYKFGRVIRLKDSDVDEFADSVRVQPGDLAHLLPKPVQEEKTKR